MESLTVYFFGFIVVFLLYSFIKLKKQKKEEKEAGKEKENIKDFNENIEKYVVAAVVATIMEGKIYKIKNIFLEEKEKNFSAWKIAGKQHNMQGRDRVK